LLVKGFEASEGFSESFFGGRSGRDSGKIDVAKIHERAPKSEQQNASAGQAQKYG